MKAYSTTVRGAALSLALLAASCMNDTEDGGPVGKGGQGIFRVEMKPAGSSTAMSGKVYNGPSPSVFAWTEDRRSGACVLWTPKAPSCDPLCGSAALCVSTNKCEIQPTAVTVGKVTVTGVKTKDGSTSFTMDPLFDFYQPTATLQYPPFAEGDLVTVSAPGDTGAGGFTLTAAGIAPLIVKEGVLLMEDGKPLVLEWTAPSRSGSKVHVEVDISHHGGTKGMIECVAEDNGRLEIAADLVTRLKALGIAGFPYVEVIRQAKSTSANSSVELLLESIFQKDITIPGLTSCSDHPDCPPGQTCQLDMTCK